MPASLSTRHRREILVENTSMKVRAKGISLWLMPADEARARLSELIDGLARRLGTERFAPHVTLLPGLPTLQASVVEGARALAAGLAPFSVSFSTVDGANQHFRCLFLGVSEGRALGEAHSRAARQFGREPDPSFDPHLSLVYGSLDAAERGALARELSGETATSFEARRLHVWQTEGPVADWCEIAVFDLGAV
jgi:2'-5' RNA ligase